MGIEIFTPTSRWAEYATRLNLPADHGAADTDEWHSKMTEQLIGQLLAKVPFESVLDVGCGEGIAAAHFVRHGKRYMGTTVSDQDAAALRAKGLPDPVYAEMSNLPFADNSFDLLYARHVLEHALALPITLLEFRRIAPVCAVVTPIPPNSIFQVGHFYTMEKAAWAHLFRQCGWKPEALPCMDTKEYRWILRRDE